MTEGAKASTPSESEMWGNVLSLYALECQRKGNHFLYQRNNLVKQNLWL